MPHIIAEYSANIAERLDPPALLRTINETAVKLGFPEGFVRSRTEPRADYLVGDGDSANAFVAIVMRIAPVITAEQRKAAGEAMFRAVRGYVDSALGDAPLSLTFELSEIDQTAAFRFDRARDGTTIAS